MSQNEIFDVTIIGGGPAGLFSAFYSGLREMKTKIIEYQAELGGKVHVYPEKMVWDVGGIPPLLGEKLIEQLVQQGLTFEPTVVLNEKITSISRDDSGVFTLHGASGQKHYSKTVILAIGGGIIKPQRIDITGAERFEVNNLHYTVKSLKRFKDKTVLISGGGDTAIDWANELEPIAKKVYVTYRNEAFTGHEAHITQLLNSTATCFFHTTITKLIANTKHDSIERVELTNHKTGEIDYIDVEDVIINHGFIREKDLIQNSALEIAMMNEWFIAGEVTSATNIPGIYAAGDVLGHEGKLHLIAGAFHDAGNAVNHAKQYLHPKANKGGLVSSHNDIFKDRNRELIKQIMK
ncbi:NAD(P)/FAD-dependent oxidoreductase [Ornithinibacillus xuwenensis]|uniref:Ferredoxin--NADP reductase n=1 Tax=Ornithinibacillus xuwenensis TaxID=3144668 RepID=A0ABU9XIE6_9BACI